MSSEETVFYKDENVLVTNTRAVFGATTYDMSNITSAGACFIQPQRTLGVILSILGCVFAWVIFLGFFIGGGLPYNLIIALLVILCLFIFGLGIILATRITCILEIRSSSGKSQGLSSRDLSYIQKVVSAMNEAIICRG
jgi:hypothetical protein